MRQCRTVRMVTNSGLNFAGRMGECAVPSACSRIDAAISGSPEATEESPTSSSAAFHNDDGGFLQSCSSKSQAGEIVQAAF